MLPKTRARRDPTDYGDVLVAAEKPERPNYTPKTNETREFYEMILSTVDGLLGDQPADVVRNATDLILGWLKDENLNDLDRLKEIKELVGSDIVGLFVF
jgi:pre-mRNA-splicing helicase BRR2